MSRFQAFRSVAAVTLTLLLTACASTGPLPDTSVASYRDTVELSGRLSVNYEHDGKPESLSGKFSWAQTPAAIDVALASPLGQTLATIKVTPDSATLTQTDRAPKVARDIDTLTAQTLGWSLPVSGLRDWLQGYATSADGQRFVASPGNNSVLTADGWRLRFVSWQNSGQNSASPTLTPKRIDAERNTGSFADELAIRIVIDPQG